MSRRSSSPNRAASRPSSPNRGYSRPMSPSRPSSPSRAYARPMSPTRPVSPSRPYTRPVSPVRPSSPNRSYTRPVSPRVNDVNINKNVNIYGGRGYPGFYGGLGYPLALSTGLLLGSSLANPGYNYYPDNYDQTQYYPVQETQYVPVPVPVQQTYYPQAYYNGYPEKYPGYTQEQLLNAQLTPFF